MHCDKKRCADMCLVVSLFLCLLIVPEAYDSGPRRAKAVVAAAAFERARGKQLSWVAFSPGLKL